MNQRARRIHLKERKRRLEEKGWWGKTWYFIWYDNSLLSWLTNILLAFILIKFIVYPGLGLLMGTGLPVVAVVSESMDHEGSFDYWWSTYALCDNQSPCKQSEWYAQYAITKEDFLNYPLANGFKRGDVILLRGVNPQDVQRGDIIVFDTDRPYPIIHRVVRAYENKGELFFETKGDHNTLQIEGVCYYPGMNPQYCLDESAIPANTLRGRASLKIPYIGYVKIWAVDLFTSFVNVFR